MFNTFFVDADLVRGYNTRIYISLISTGGVMNDFYNIKKGQKLLKKIREEGFYPAYGGRKVPSQWAKTLWEEVVVEKTSSVSYWVDGVKYRISDCGNQIRNFHMSGIPSFYFPFDENGEPIVLATAEEVEETAVLFKKILDLISRRASSCYFDLFKDLEGVDLKTASELAENIQKAAKNLDDAVSVVRKLARKKEAHQF